MVYMNSTENRTYTADQIVAIGGRRWERGDKVRVYLNDWAELVGLETGRYNSGNLRWASLGDEDLSNRKANLLLSAKVYWENGRIVTDLARVADSANLDGAALVERLHAGIAAKVGA